MSLMIGKTALKFECGFDLAPKKVFASLTEVLFAIQDGTADVRVLSDGSVWVACDEKSHRGLWMELCPPVDGKPASLELGEPGA